MFHSIAWRLISHDATQPATCTHCVLTLDVAVTLNSKAGSSTDSRADVPVGFPRGILGNLRRLLLWHYG